MNVDGCSVAVVIIIIAATAGIAVAIIEVVLYLISQMFTKR